MKSNLSKIFIILVLFSLFALNFYSVKNKSDNLTQDKIQFFKLNSSSNFIGRLNLWYFFAGVNDWNNATKFETGLNQTQIFKLNHQPEKLLQKLNELKAKSNKDAQDYLTLAKTQSILGFNQDAVESIKQAHQLDPIRSDLDQLFYSITK
ncbi:MAG: hypothetical protein PHX34_03795 [Candidatus Shapirobacteria bacterium]|nr:hypothetical protein [Candidatus Shapirobacteria bacterium]